MSKIVRCAVACINSNGEPDLFFCKVICSQEEIENGVHYTKAKQKAEEDGYESYLAYDEFDVAGQNIMKLFLWGSIKDCDIVR